MYVCTIITIIHIECLSFSLSFLCLQSVAFRFSFPFSLFSFSTWHVFGFLVCSFELREKAVAVACAG